MLSGIGPAAELKVLGITPLANLSSVGSNLIEHAMLYLGYRARSGTIADELRFDRATWSALRWRWFGNGAIRDEWTRCSDLCPTIPIGIGLTSSYRSCGGDGRTVGVSFLAQATPRSLNGGDDDAVQQPRANMPALRKSIRPAVHPLQLDDIIVRHGPKDAPHQNCAGRLCAVVTKRHDYLRNLARCCP